MSSPYRRAALLAAIYAGASVAERAIGFLLLPLYTFYLDPSDFGLLALLTLSANLATRLVSSPINSALMRFYHHPEYRARRGELLTSLLLLLAAKSLALAGLWWLARVPLCRTLLGDLVWLPLIDAYALVLVLQPLAGLFTATLRVRERAGYASFVVLSGLLLTVALVLYLLAVPGIGVAALVYGQVFNFGYTALLAGAPYLREAARSASRAVLRAPLRFGYPLLVAGYANLLIQAGDRYVLAFYTSLNEVGLYNFGYTFGALITLLLVDPTQRSFQPVLLRQEEEPEALRAFVRRSATAFYAFGTWLALALSLYARELIQLMASKPSFEPAWVIVPVIAFSALQHGLGGFLGAGLLMRQKAFHISALLLLAAAVNIGLNFLLIPPFGILGAAFATLASYLVWNALRARLSARFYALHFERRRLLALTGLGVGLLAAGLLAAPPLGLWGGLAVKTLAVLAYPALLVATGLVRPDERELLRGVLRRVRRDGLRAALREITR